ncbi:MAG: lytic transglycosylase domain-containing protein, partial [Actinomycetota bacterium]|nr:lytic transglycosylase domain-containing protein [Actinomycetota bacterium]
MKRLAVVAALALALAGSAGADVFRVLPMAAPSTPAVLPSAEIPNGPGSIAFPDSLRSRPLVTETRTYAQLLDLWQRDGAAYGVPWEVLASINKVESNFGRNMGPSSAGAIGWMQFIPSTWERWGVDADGDGLANPWNPEDAIAAAARYLAASGGQSDISRAVFSYNHAQWYVDEVLQLSQLFGAGGVDATFNLDRLQISLDKARGVVVRVNRKLVKALRTERSLARREHALARRAVAATLLSDRLARDRRTVQAGVV